MKQQCQAHIEQALNAAGVTMVQAKAEDASRHQGQVYATLAWGDEKFRYDGSLVAVADNPDGTRTLRRRLYIHTIPLSVKIVHRDPAALAAAERSFVAALARRIFDADGNAVLVTLTDGEPLEDASILKQRESVTFTVTFEGGIYKDKTITLIDISTSMDIETEATPEL